MCGRFALDIELSTQVGARLGIAFNTPPNDDVRPTHTVATVAWLDDRLQQLNTHWGIKPEWATHWLINAKAETVTGKKTFARAFAEHRCLVPCSGWYEWRDEGGPRKQKYRFEHASGDELYMAGIWYPAREHEASPALVTLTTQPDELCAQYHNRMPLLIAAEHIHYWFGSTPEQLTPLLTPTTNTQIAVTASDQ
ncbi:SOS response-associated peptidase [Zobellella maritima]|uniref:SOS response-associated peptidase n=1 Tax=Zobellella maritima TaxID=2059725 RepID=UPI000E30AD36|nr:SOS response-associated peptidase family protein [Zobellella maritima]